MSKINVVKELSLALDGMSIESPGFEIVSVSHTKKNTWEVVVKAYRKEGDSLHEDKVSLSTLVDRLYRSYVSGLRCEVVYAKKKTEDIFLFIAEVEGEGEEEEDETEDGSRVKEQVEA